VRPPIPKRLPAVASRVGIDLNPVDVRDPDTVLWFRALIWPEHHERLELLMRAIQLARQDPPELIAGDALELLPQVIATIPGDTPVCVFHTQAVNQFPREARERLTPSPKSTADGVTCIASQPSGSARRKRSWSWSLTNGGRRLRSCWPMSTATPGGLSGWIAGGQLLVLDFAFGVA